MNFILNRDRVVASLCGRSVEFKKGVPTYVPPAMHKDVIAIGAVPEDELPDDEKKAPEMTAEERKAKITEAMKTMLAENKREDFTATGIPHNKALSTRVGFAVDARERDAVWGELNKAE